MSSASILAKRGFHGRTAEAVLLVLDQDYTQAEASRKIGVNQAAVSRMLTKLRDASACSYCGQTIKELPK